MNDPKYNPEDVKSIASTPKIKEVVIYADEVAVIYYTNGACEHVGDVSYSDAFLVVDEGDVE